MILTDIRKRFLETLLFYENQTSPDTWPMWAGRWVTNTPVKMPSRPTDAPVNTHLGRKKKNFWDKLSLFRKLITSITVQRNSSPSQGLRFFLSPRILIGCVPTCGTGAKAFSPVCYWANSTLTQVCTLLWRCGYLWCHRPPGFCSIFHRYISIFPVMIKNNAAG